jgi:putative hemolysin
LDPALVFDLVVLAALSTLSGLFSGSEAALFSLTPLQLEGMAERRVPTARAVRSLLAVPRRLLITILSGNEVANVAISAVAGGIGIRMGVPTWAVVAATTVFLLILCEVFPKTVGRRWPEAWSAVAVGPLRIISWVLAPVRAVLERIVRFLEGPAETAETDRKRSIGEGEFLMLVGLGLQGGAIRAQEGQLIEAVFELGDTEAAGVMTPRTELFALPMGTTLSQALAQIRETLFSRVPVYGSDLDDIRGILYGSDLIREVARGGGRKPVESICRAPVYVPENKQVAELFRMLRRKKIHMVVVVDEYGGVSGIVTLDDILRKLFGEIRDEYDAEEEERPQSLGEGVYLVPGRTTVDGFNELMDAGFDPGDNETVAGVVFTRMGHLPKVGEIVAVGGFLFKVLEMDGNRIASLRVSREKANGQ